MVWDIYLILSTFYRELMLLLYGVDDYCGVFNFLLISMPVDVYLKHVSRLMFDLMISSVLFLVFVEVLYDKLMIVLLMNSKFGVNCVLIYFLIITV